MAAPPTAPATAPATSAPGAVPAPLLNVCFVLLVINAAFFWPVYGFTA
jgi:hypothetical protein